MKKTLAVIAALVAGALVFAGGAKDTGAASKSTLSGTYTFGGSTTVQPIANAAIEQFVKANPNVKITYEGLGSSTGLKQLLAKTVTLAGSSRDLKQSELDGGCKPVVIALDSIAIVVNKDIPVADLSMDQVAGIFSGSIVNWKEVGGPDEVITVVVRDETSGTFGSFKELVLDPKKVEYTKNAIVSKENGEVAAKVATTPGAIGYVGLGFVEEITKAGGKALSVGGVLPSVATTKDHSYPISRNLYMATLGDAAEGSVEKAFIDYVLSARGIVIVKEAGFVPLK